MYASKPTDAKTPESTGRLLLIIGTALALVDGLLYVVGQLGTRYIQPKLHALRIFARSFAPHTQDPTAQVVIEALRHREIYLYGQLIAARDVLTAAHDQYVWLLWRSCVIGFGVWCVALLIFRLLETWDQAAEASRPCRSPMGIKHEDRFIPCPLPMPTLARVSLVPTRLQRWAMTLGLRPIPSVLTQVMGLPLWSPLARAVLEHYLAVPTCPAEIAKPDASGPSHRHGIATLLEHVLSVRSQALSVAEHFNLPVPLVEQVALAHDLGKLATFQKEDGHWIRAIRHHDRMSGLLLTTIPEWQALPPEDREEIRLAVRFHHAPDSLPSTASGRTKALVALIARVHKATSRQEADAAGLSQPPVPSAAATVLTPPSPSAFPSPPASPPGPAGAPEEPPVDTSPSPAPLPPGDPESSAGATGPPASESGPAAPATTDQPIREANPASPLLPVDRALQEPLTRALLAALPHLRINITQDFTGLTIPEAGLLVLLDPPLRGTLAERLTPEEGSRLQISAIEAQANRSGSKMPVPHAADANLAAAFRRLGWLVERYKGRTGTLWRVTVGRRTWLACWLLDLAALPREAIAGWAATPKYPASPTEPSWLDPYHPVSPQDAATTRQEKTLPPSDPPGRITPGCLLALALLGGAGWFLLHPPAERTTLTCDSADRIAQWVKGESSTASEWDLKVKDAVDSLRAACPGILEKLSPTRDNTVERAKEYMESALHRTFGSAKRLRDTRPIMAVIDGTTLKIGVLGEARLLGITVPPEAQARARAYLEQACLRDGAPRRLVVHLFKEKDAEGYPLVVVYAEHRDTQELTADLAINQQLLDRGLAQPWSLPVCTDLWSNHQPRPVDCTQG